MSAAKKDVLHTSVLFTGTAISTPCICNSSGDLYQIHNNEFRIHNIAYQIEETSSVFCKIHLHLHLFSKFTNFLHILLLHIYYKYLSQTTTTLQWIFKIWYTNTLIRHFVAYGTHHQ